MTNVKRDALVDHLLANILLRPSREQMGWVVDHAEDLEEQGEHIAADLVRHFGEE
jgi:hypothetical protein